MTLAIDHRCRVYCDGESFKIFEPLKGYQHIKSVGIHPLSGQMIYTQPEESWWTFHVRFMNPDRSFAFPDIKVYKARWITD